MSQEKMREEFEAWFEGNKNFMLGVRKVSKGDCFFIWRSSRAAVVVDLSKHHGGHVLEGTERMFLSDVVDAIEAAGLEMKP